MVVRRGSTVIPKASFFSFTVVLLFCLFKTERKERTCYLLLGSHARSLFGELVYVRNSEKNFEPFTSAFSTISHVPDIKKSSHTLDTTTSKCTLRERLVSIQAEGVSMAEGLERLTCNPEDPSLSPALNASWISSR